MKYLLAVLASLSLIFGYLSYSFHSSKEKAESALKGALETNATLANSLLKREQECRIMDETISAWQKEKDASDKQKHSDITKIDLIPKKAPVVRAEVQNNEIDIDSPLPTELSRVLSEAYNRDKGDTSANTK